MLHKVQRMLREKEGQSSFEIHVGMSELLLTPYVLSLPSTPAPTLTSRYQPRLYNLEEL